uniref:Caudal-like activation domain-containing protein n=1 Tax=Xiphophorus couchianus TaxID=32473 RepID=A0A3B5LG13_9TELE
MYVSYLQLDKEPTMYPHQNPVSRHPGLSLSSQNFPVPGPPQYPDFPGYHPPHPHGLSAEPHPAYPPPAREDWTAHQYAAAVGAPTAGAGPALSFQEFPGQPSALLPAALNPSAGQLSPGSPRRRNPYDWIRTSAPPSNPSKNRNQNQQLAVWDRESRRSQQRTVGHFNMSLVPSPGSKPGPTGQGQSLKDGPFRF